MDRHSAVIVLGRWFPKLVNHFSKNSSAETTLRPQNNQQCDNGRKTWIIDSDLESPYAPRSKVHMDCRTTSVSREKLIRDEGIEAGREGFPGYSLKTAGFYPPR